jgi:hypothetical protein
MDAKNIRNLIEAYVEVYAPQEEIEEAVKGADTEMRKAASAERRVGDKPLSKKEGDKNAAHMAGKIKMADKLSKAKGHMPGYTYGEEVDIFDTVLEFLQTEGYENPEQMMTELSSEEIDAILEASYSAKAARAGKDIGKPGKAFAKIAASAGKRYGSKERGEKVAGAVLAKLRAKKG